MNEKIYAGHTKLQYSIGSVKGSEALQSQQFMMIDRNKMPATSGDEFVKVPLSSSIVRDKRALQNTRTTSG